MTVRAGIRPVEQEDTGPRGNERLTATLGAVLIVLFAVEGVTILRVGDLLTLHSFVGVALLGPIAVKLGSTGYRFARYYMKNPAYRRAGPPMVVMRVLAPLLVLATAGVFGTGIALLAVGRRDGTLVQWHKVSFVFWIVLAGLHVLVYLWRLPALIGADWRPLRRSRARRRNARASLVVLGLGAGALAAVLTLGADRTLSQHHSDRLPDNPQTTESSAP